MSPLGAPGIVDVVSGDNTVSFKQDGKWYTVDGFPALPGYDLASGVGTVDAPYFVPEASRWQPAIRTGRRPSLLAPSALRADLRSVRKLPRQGIGTSTLLMM